MTVSTNLVGLRIGGVRPVTMKELTKLGWEDWHSELPLAIELIDDNNVITHLLYAAVNDGTQPALFWFRALADPWTFRTAKLTQHKGYA